MNDRTPPCALDAERSCLGAVLIAPRLFPDLVAALDVGDFFLPSHRHIFEGMTAIHGRRQSVDLIALGDELKTRGMLLRLEGGEGYLTTLANACPTVENLAHYCRIVKEKAILRSVISVAGELASRAYGDPGDLAEYLTDARRLVGQATAGGLVRRAVTIDHVMSSTLTAVERRWTSELATGYPIGLPTLGRVLGELQPESLTVVAGRPGMGKSAFAWNVIIRGAQLGLPALMCSLEMSEWQLGERAIAFQSLLTVNQLHTSQGGRENGYERFREAHTAAVALRKLPIEVVAHNMALEDIETEARAWRNEHAGVGLVVVDYLQLARLKRRDRGMSRKDVVTELSAGLKGLAKDLKVPVLAVAQLNRESEKDDRRPQMRDLAESGSIEQDADTVIFIYRQKGKPNGKDYPLAKDEAELRVDKNRDGDTGKAIVRWDGPRNVFEDFEPAEAQLRGR